MKTSSRTSWSPYYLLLLVASVGSVFGLARFGDAWFVGPGRVGLGLAAAREPAILLSTLSALFVVIVMAQVMGRLFRKLGQPPVIGEVLGGILLGPSALGALAPELALKVLPVEARGSLNILAQVGVLLFMFLIGLELDLGSLRKSGRAALLISHASIVLPFLLGMGAAFAIYRSYAPPGVPFSGFALFLGVSMSVTAFPVLARILVDTGLNKTTLGALALTCAAVDDATAWCLLAIVVGLLRASLDAAVMTLVLIAIYVPLMIFVARPIFARLIPWLERSSERVSEASLAFILACVVLSALATEWIGVHALFGGFLLGAILPAESLTAHDLNNRLGDLVRVFFLPAFFAYTGLRTQIGLLDNLTDVGLALGLIAIATIGKVGGAFVAAKLAGLSTRQATIIGVLMNTRGLVELIVLNVGLDLGVISPKLFAMLVLMAVTTTMATGPLLKWVRGPSPVNDGE